MTVLLVLIDECMKIDPDDRKDIYECIDTNLEKYIHKTLFSLGYVSEAVSVKLELFHEVMNILIDGMYQYDEIKHNDLKHLIIDVLDTSDKVKIISDKLSSKKSRR